MFIIDIVLSIAYYLLSFYMLCLFIKGILNLVGADPQNPLVAMLNVLSDPPCRWLVRKYPKLILRNDNGAEYDLSLLALLLSSGCALIIIKKISIYLGFTV